VYFGTRLLRREIEARTELSDTQTFQMFSLPDERTPEKCSDFNLKQYRKYIRSIDALANVHGARCAFFIQPCPAIGKTLTEQERKVAGDLQYADTYRRMEQDLLTLHESGVPIVSLVDVFAHVKETVYVDPIHSGWQTGKGYVGYRIIAEAMAKHLARLWDVAPAENAESRAK
jgi:hypothetical protein